jgi:hypothetical protein
MHPNDEQDLRAQARKAICSKALPRREPDHTFGGPGNGGPCPVCGAPLGTADMVFDLEFDIAGGRTVDCQVHVRCFAAWEYEREHLSEQDPLRSSDAESRLQRSERESSNS